MREEEDSEDSIRDELLLKVPRPVPSPHSPSLPLAQGLILRITLTTPTPPHTPQPCDSTLSVGYEVLNKVSRTLETPSPTVNALSSTTLRPIFPWGLLKLCKLCFFDPEPFPLPKDEISQGPAQMLPPRFQKPARTLRAYLSRKKTWSAALLA